MTDHVLILKWADFCTVRVNRDEVLRRNGYAKRFSTVERAQDWLKQKQLWYRAIYGEPLEWQIKVVEVGQ